MARSKKGSRSIVVGSVKYRWRASGTDGGISLTVWPDDLPGPIISCTFDYHQRATPIGNGVTQLTGQVVVTSRIVRRVIEHAVRELAYDPKCESKPLILRRIDKTIDMTDALRSG